MKRVPLCFALLFGISLATAPLVSHAAGTSRTFTIAVIPDTQNYLDYKHQRAEGFPFDAADMFVAQMEHISQRLQGNGGDVAFVVSVGDVWQHQSKRIDPVYEAKGYRIAPNPFMETELAPTEKVHTFEMPLAADGFRRLEGKVPFAVVPGNHDYDAVWTDANHPPKPEVRRKEDVGLLVTGGVENFVGVFGAESEFFKGKPWYVSAHDGGADSAQIFQAGGYTFLHIGLQFQPSMESLAWAQSVIDQHPGLPTIIATHDYLNLAGERLPHPAIDTHVVDANKNTPQMMWENLIEKNDQIFLVLCGHEGGQAFRDDRNRKGHHVYQVLSDFQDRAQTAIAAGLKPGPFLGVGDGWMRFMTFDMASKTPTVKVRTYSTYYKTFSTEMPTYAAWYKAAEKPTLSDADFNAQDDFVIDLPDFRARFDKTARNARR